MNKPDTFISTIGAKYKFQSAVNILILFLLGLSEGSGVKNTRRLDPLSFSSSFITFIYSIGHALSATQRTIRKFNRLIPSQVMEEGKVRSETVYPRGSK